MADVSRHYILTEDHRVVTLETGDDGVVQHRPNNQVEVTDEALSSGQIRTYTGRAFSPLDPNPDDIVIEDIAHALSLNCRFTGHVRWHYSVAQHSVLCSEIVPSEYALTALLHDASEAYLSDIARPIKQQPDFGDTYLRYEGALERAIAERFSLDYPFPK